MKKIKLISSISLLLAVAAAPAFAAARHAGLAVETSRSAGASAQSGFCARFSPASQTYGQGINRQIANLKARISRENTEAQAHENQFAQKLNQDRSAWAKNRQDIYSRLEARAKTDAEKQAVATFQTAIENAVSARESAVNAARTAFWQGLDQLISQHRTAIGQVLNNYLTAVQAAITKAQSSCAGGASSSTVRQAFFAALRSARQARIQGMQSVDKIGPQVSALVHTRNEAVKQAVQTYENALKAAVAALKAVFAVSTNSPASSASGAANSSSSSNSAGTNQ